MTREREGKYQAYLLRLWCDQVEEGWRASLQTAADARPIGFADLEALFAYLLRVTSDLSRQKEDDNEQ